MARRNKSSPILIPSNLGRCALVLEEDEVVRLLRAAVEREGSPTAFARRHGLERSQLNETLNGKRPVSISHAKALGLRKMYVAE